MNPLSCFSASAEVRATVAPSWTTRGTTSSRSSSSSGSLRTARERRGDLRWEAVDLQKVRGRLPHCDDGEAHVRSEAERVELDIRLEDGDLSPRGRRVPARNDVLDEERRAAPVPAQERDPMAVRQPAVATGDETAPGRDVRDPEDRRPVREANDLDRRHGDLVHEGDPYPVGRDLGEDVASRSDDLRVRAVRPDLPNAPLRVVERDVDDRGAVAGERRVLRVDAVVGNAARRAPVSPGSPDLVVPGARRGPQQRL